MSRVDDELARARAEIDRIDQALHALIMERTEVVGAIARIKRDAEAGASPSVAGYYRPDREAAVLRALLKRHAGAFPPVALVRLWREIMAVSLRLQFPFGVIVGADITGGLHEIARDHFGVETPVRVLGTASEALALLATDPAAVTVLPWPDEGIEPWWPALAAAPPETRPTVLSALPFVASQPRAVVLAFAPREAGERHHSLVAIKADGAAASDALFGAGLAPFRLIARSDDWQLAEIGGFVAPDDPRVAAVADGRIGAATVLGGFAVPGPAAAPAQGTAP